MMRWSLLGLLTVAALIAQAPVPKKAVSTVDRTRYQRCWTLRAEGKMVDSTNCFVALSSAKEAVYRAEGEWGLGKYQEALAAFETALKDHPQDPYVRIRFGTLFWERFNKAEAVKLMNEALELDPINSQGMLMLARILARGFDAKAMDLARAAANQDPALYQAWELVARLELENSNEAKAAEAAAKALAISPNALDARATLGIIELLKNKPTDEFDKIFAINPRYGEAWFLAGHHFVLNRRYDEAIGYYKRAIAIRPDLWEAHEQLGINLMRTGKAEEARQELELAYNAGYHTNEVVNSLRLMDSYRNFLTFKFDGGEVRIHKKEADVLHAYFEEEMTRARASYEAKYKYHMDAPLQVEVYPDHDDFAVRTLGMPGLGATGVSFGPVVAMDSPSARKPGQYHWASTLWHELSHSYILTMSKYLVPRWFTEGISVHEETQASPEWGDNIEPSILMAVRDKKLLPVEDLDQGFVRPKDPMQIMVSYFQAGQAIDWIVETYGQDTVNAMVKSYAERKTTGDVVRQHLKIEPKEFDAKLDSFIRARYGKSIDNLKEWSKAIEQTGKAFKAKDWEATITAGKKMLELYPQYVSEGSAYNFLGKAYMTVGNKAAARETFRAYAKEGGRDPELLKYLAQLEEEAGDKALAAAALQRLIYVSPVGDEDLHKRLGEYYLALNQPRRALAAFQAQLASKPVDPAGTYYNLARSYLALSRRQEAQDYLFQALEAAPGYKPAQKLLLELESKSRTP